LDSDTRLPAILLTHDGELDDVRVLLGELDADPTERLGGFAPGDPETVWDLVVGTGRRLLELREATPEPRMRIAVLGDESRTLRTMLLRAGVDLLIRRPVHPAALRLLLVHALYRGPEKRRCERVGVGAPVRFRAGLRRSGAILADLSLRGCRLIASTALAPGRRIAVLLPASVSCGRKLKLRGRVVRVNAADADAPKERAVAVAFGRLSRRKQARLASTIAVHRTGPAVLATAVENPARPATAGATPGRSGSAPAKPARPSTGLPVPSCAPASRPPVPGVVGAGPPGAVERRSEARHDYSRRVVALSDEADRVLLGRDVSLGGMRIDATGAIAVGDELRVALHVRARQDPLVLQARVERDDGENGIFLVFHSLSAPTREYLENMIKFLPILASRGNEGHGAGVIVTEVLEHRAAVPA
jgi:hypothetical protein